MVEQNFKVGDRVEVTDNHGGQDSYVGHRGTVREAYPDDEFVQVALDGDDHLIYEFYREEVTKID